MTGNQNVLIEDNELAKASDNIFGKGFFDTYGVDFIYSLRIMSTFQAEMLSDGMYAMTVIDMMLFSPSTYHCSPKALPPPCVPF